MPLKWTESTSTELLHAQETKTSKIWTLPAATIYVENLENVQWSHKAFEISCGHTLAFLKWKGLIFLLILSKNGEQPLSVYLGG